MSNSHINEYLNYYCNLKTSPKYAVLIKGKWGSGKTWFISQYLNDLDNQEIKYLYVSLYGVSDFKGIESEFFRQLHPVLSKKGMELAGKLAKGVLKASLKVDLDGDGKSDGSVDFSLTNIPSYLVNTNDRILIFDDVERCTIPISDLLGYINNFVEHKEYKAILVSNEEEIGTESKRAKINRDQEEDKSPEKIKYLRIKEKLIGRTFEITPNIDNAFPVFLTEIENTFALNVFEKNSDIIKDTFRKSAYLNLRYLRQSILEMERIISVFPTKAVVNKKFMSDFVNYYLIYSTEVRSGNYSAKEITHMQYSPKSVLNPSSKNKGIFEKIGEKYEINLRDVIFPESIWFELIDKGIIDIPKLNQAIDASKYFVDNKTPEWRQLWYYFTLTDTEIDALLKTVKSDFKSRKHESIGELLHITGLLMKFSRWGILPDKIETIAKEAKRYANHLNKSGKLLQFSNHLGDSHTGAYGLGYNDYDREIFIEFYSYCKNLYEKSLIKSLPEKAKKLLELLDDDYRMFYKQLTGYEDGINYTNTPILKYVDKNQFLSIFLKLNFEGKISVINSICDRYNAPIENLSDEKLWLEDVAILFKKKLKGKLLSTTRYTLTQSSERLFDAVNKIEKDMERINMLGLS